MLGKPLLKREWVGGGKKELWKNEKRGICNVYYIWTDCNLFLKKKSYFPRSIKKIKNIKPIILESNMLFLLSKQDSWNKNLLCYLKQVSMC